MKNKLLLAGLLIIAGAVLLKVGMVWGQSAGVITSVCKTNGGILMDKNNCPAGSEKWLIGSGGSGSNVGTGYILFSGQYSLSRDGKIWYYEFSNEDGNIPGWKELGNVPVDVSTIIQWYGIGSKSFLTNEGDYYQWGPEGWINLQDPSRLPSLTSTQ